MNYGIKTLNNIRVWQNENVRTAFIVKAIIGSMILAVSAQMVIPTPFVPFTAQTLALVLLALTLGRYAAVSAVVLYILEGASGLPVFSGGGLGIATLAGPTGGFIFGFLPATFIMGYFADKGARNSIVKTSMAVLIGHVALYTFGLLQLSLFVPTDKVLAFGFLPFVFGDIAKIVMASLLVPFAYKVFSKIK